MSAETLRRAAALMRERGEAAGAAPWYADARPAELPGDATSTYLRHSVWGTDAYGKGNTPYIAEANGRSGAEHIASWHPAVALAVADWLDEAADEFGAQVGSIWISCAQSVARAYLGEQP